MFHLLEQAFKLLDELGSTTKKNEKLAILEKGKDNEVLRRIFFLTFNDFITFGLKEYGEVTADPSKPINEEAFTKLDRILMELNNRTFTGGEAIGIVNNFMNSVSVPEQLWYGRIIRRDLKVGVSAKTVNKVIPGTIPTFECMLAKAWHKVKKRAKFIIIEPKLDGYRAVIFVKGDSVTIRSRNGHIILGFTSLEKELAKFPDGVYDAELTGKDNHFTDMQTLAFAKVENKEAYCNFFDYLADEQEFWDSKSKLTLRERKLQLKEIFEKQEGKKDTRLVAFSDVLPGDSPKIDEYYKVCLDNGFEGIMVKDADSIYKQGKHSDWLKIKPVDTFDLEIVGVEQGDPHGKYANTLGAFVCEYKGNTVNVSGMKDKLRDEVWSNPNEYIGKIIEVEAQEESSNQKGTQSLRFPQFKRFRLDK